MEHATAKRNNNIYAVKVVRGAYLDEERRLAQEQGYEGERIYQISELVFHNSHLYSHAYI